MPKRRALVLPVLQKKSPLLSLDVPRNQAVRPQKASSPRRWVSRKSNRELPAFWGRKEQNPRKSPTALEIQPKCGWTSPSGIFVCVRPKGHTGNHGTVRRV